MTAAAVELVGVRRRFGRVTALRGVDLVVDAGSFVAVMGETGSGKSTLLHCAAGLDRPTSGTVRLAGEELTGVRERRRTRVRRNHAGFVFQSYDLLSELTVRANVLLPVRLGAPQAQDVDHLLDAVGLTGHGRVPVGRLSGGQRQRVAVARALVTGPDVVFADEPTAALDPVAAAQVLRLLRSAADGRGTSVVLVTHDAAAAGWSDRLVMLRDGEVVVDLPTPDVGRVGDLLNSVSGLPSAAQA